MKKPDTTYLKDWRPPAYWVDQVDLTFELDEADTIVTSEIQLRQNPDRSDNPSSLRLDGRDLELVSISLDGRRLDPLEYHLNRNSLLIFQVPHTFSLKMVTRLHPCENTSLEGLYTSQGNFFTQCEAQGFQKITYFPDRPDVMARYRTTIIADKARYPVLLSNGNPTDSGEMAGNRHWAEWEDPFKKPAYLFALVAGQLVRIQDRFITASGRKVALHIYVEKENADKCTHAMLSLKKAMRWDEVTYGREYDLDVYMIVAVNDFNMGAMENKGLNIFNSKYVLARPETATDMDFQHIEGVIAHEYFHNWTGNRITLKNWFQLSLKEGLTVFREQQFLAEETSGPAKRINDVLRLRNLQFPEDAGPMAHPVRPDAYVQINNFYTMTVYQKGAEVIRMIFTLLGPENFYRAMDLYFRMFDGQAITIDDFISAMEDGGDMDLEQFRLWYSQAGTPQLTVDRSYDFQKNIYTLTFLQECPSTPGQQRSDKTPMHIPVAIGLIDSSGKDIDLQLEGEPHSAGTTRVLGLRRKKETFSFVNIFDLPIPSILRGFSAPVKIQAAYSDEELYFLWRHDCDPFNRWEAGQRIIAKLMLALIANLKKGTELQLSPAFLLAFQNVLADDTLDKALTALTLTLPAETELGFLMQDAMGEIDVDAVHTVRQFVIRSLADHLGNDFMQVYNKNHNIGRHQTDQAAIARRSLKNLALFYLAHQNVATAAEFIYDQFQRADNMTDEIAALNALTDMDCMETEKALDQFYRKWKSDPLVLDKWFAAQAGSRLPQTLKKVQTLTHHRDFSLKNPNKVRALIGIFCHQNQFNFHQKTGAGYQFLADRIIELDPINPQMASQLASAFNRWKQFDPKRKMGMKLQLRRIKNTPNLSTNVFEIVAKALN
jgi:aminopeptidase N